MDIGDRVKVIIESYEGFIKSALWTSQAWRSSQGREDPFAMLGGEYEILKLDGSYAQVTDINENSRGMVHTTDLVILSDVSFCKYNIGEYVKLDPSPQASNVDILHLKRNFPDINKQYEIKYVLNEYYLFFENEKETDYPAVTPFRWEDFRKV